MLKNLLNRSSDKITGQITFDRSLLDDTPEPSALKKTGQTVLAIFGLLFLFILLWGIIGTPYLRWDQPLVDGKDGTDLQEANLAFTRYISVSDTRRVHAGEYGEGLPWLIFIPLSDTEE